MVASTVATLLLLVVALAVSVALVGREATRPGPGASAPRRYPSRPGGLWTRCTLRSPRGGWRIRRNSRPCGASFLEKALAFYQEFAREEADRPRSRARAGQGVVPRGADSGPARTAAGGRRRPPRGRAALAGAGCLVRGPARPREELAETYAALGLYLGLSGRWIEGTGAARPGRDRFPMNRLWPGSRLSPTAAGWCWNPGPPRRPFADRRAPTPGGRSSPHSAAAAAEHLDDDFPGQAVPQEAPRLGPRRTRFRPLEDGYCPEAERVLNESIDLAHPVPGGQFGAVPMPSLTEPHHPCPPVRRPPVTSVSWDASSFPWIGHARPRRPSSGHGIAQSAGPRIPRRGVRPRGSHAGAGEPCGRLASDRAVQGSRAARRCGGRAGRAARRRVPWARHFPQRLLAHGLRLLAQLRAAGGRGEEAEDLFIAPLAVAEQLAAAGPRTSTTAPTWAGSCLDLGKHLIRRGGYPSEAEGQLLRAMKLFDDLATDHPDSQAYRLLLAETHTALGGSLLHRGRQTEAERSFRRARERYEELLNRHVDDPRTWHHAARFFATCPQPHLPQTRAVRLNSPGGPSSRAPQEGSRGLRWAWSSFAPRTGPAPWRPCGG